MPNVKAIDRRAPLKHFYCLVCGNYIPPERLVRKSVTCSEDHAKILKLERRRLRDTGNRCKTCNRPNTPAERKMFALWRKTLPKQGKKRGPKPQPKPVLEAGTS